MGGHGVYCLSSSSRTQYLDIARADFACHRRLRLFWSAFAFRSCCIRRCCCSPREGQHTTTSTRSRSLAVGTAQGWPYRVLAQHLQHPTHTAPALASPTCLLSGNLLLCARAVELHAAGPLEKDSTPQVTEAVLVTAAVRVLPIRLSIGK